MRNFVIAFIIGLLILAAMYFSGRGGKGPNVRDRGEATLGVIIVGLLIIGAILGGMYMDKHDTMNKRPGHLITTP